MGAAWSCTHATGPRVLELWLCGSPPEFALELVRIILHLTRDVNPMSSPWRMLSKLMPKRWPTLEELWFPRKEAG